ncbi:hypothetical protein A3715_19155 [Oleiphilus sp. HI0009]|nr:hypothetical protein A3715_14775 [Oleiphilus sp. HI0009]KZX80822.1 hypothetical protein A3715_19155 [Oleiphilus sp. HI0009]KZY69858.1 hypothetical protein A3739_07915 [Oleiphilus sp. HI0067]KZY72320.1 hypothetical protein A3738_00150 [Oleiphilus sp. HI0066]
MYLAKWTILLAVFWLLLSGFMQPLLLSFGAISVAIVLLVIKRMDVIDEQPRTIGSPLAALIYIPWLLYQIFLSSIQVTRLIWTGKTKVSPSIAKLPVSSVPENKKVLYANSITLTPGTLSVDLDEEEVTVHALESSSIEELKQGGMADKIAKTWGKKNG